MNLVKMSNRYKSGKIETHYAVSANSDLSICGHDLVGDFDWNGLGVTPGRKVNCPDCIHLAIDAKIGRSDDEIYNACVNHSRQRKCPSRKIKEEK